MVFDLKTRTITVDVSKIDEKDVGVNLINFGLSDEK